MVDLLSHKLVASAHITVYTSTPLPISAQFWTLHRQWKLSFQTRAHALQGCWMHKSCYKKYTTFTPMCMLIDRHTIYPWMTGDTSERWVDTYMCGQVGVDRHTMHQQSCVLTHYCTDNNEQVEVGTQPTHYCTDNTEQVKMGTQLTHCSTDNTEQVGVGTQRTHYCTDNCKQVRVGTQPTHYSTDNHWMGWGGHTTDPLLYW